MFNCRYYRIIVDIYGSITYKYLFFRSTSGYENSDQKSKQHPFPKYISIIFLQPSFSHLLLRVHGFILFSTAIHNGQVVKSCTKMKKSEKLAIEVAVGFIRISLCESIVSMLRTGKLACLMKAHSVSMKMKNMQ